MLQPTAKILKIRNLAIDDLSRNGICLGAVVGVAVEILVLKHQHPGFSLLDQAQAEGLAQGVTRSQQGGIALVPEEITRSIPGELVDVCKRLDQPLLALIEARRLQEILQPLKRFAVIAEELLPENIFLH